MRDARGQVSHDGQVGIAHNTLKGGLVEEIVASHNGFLHHLSPEVWVYITCGEREAAKLSLKA